MKENNTNYKQSYLNMLRKIIFLILAFFFTSLSLFVIFISIDHDKYFSVESDILLFERVYPKYENGKLTEFIQPTFVNEYVNLSNFNYEGKCREPFRYKQNNEKDLVFTAIKYHDINLWERDKKFIKMTSDMMKNTIPNAKKVCVIYENFNELSKFIKECGFEPIEVKMDDESLKKLNAPMDRFLQLDKYLKEHEGHFERIALIDFRDVLFFCRWISNNIRR